MSEAADLPTVEELIRHRLSTALGGWRGALETALPTIVFVGLWTGSKDVRVAVGGAVAAAVVLVVLRLLHRSSLQHVGAAILGTAVAAFFAIRSGRAEDAFLPGIVASIAWGIGAVVSVLVRWPVVGFLVGAGDPNVARDPFGWRRDRGVVRVCGRLTLVLAAMYAVRAAVMVPLYLGGEVAWLGVGKIGLGWPLWVGALAVMAVLLVRGSTPQEVPTVDSAATVAEHPHEHPEHSEHSEHPEHPEHEPGRAP
ncbi:MAG TPA: DUF3159 domain-containing protein [Dermatophilaceae bacterium]|nr:DUF3159 domain-containing protein [Dermatophilaceae bacterium]